MGTALHPGHFGALQVSYMKKLEGAEKLTFSASNDMDFPTSERAPTLESDG